MKFTTLSQEQIDNLKTRGKPSQIELLDYDHYRFHIAFDVGFQTYEICVGGKFEGMFEFDPFGGWESWEAFGILELREADVELEETESLATLATTQIEEP